MNAFGGRPKEPREEGHLLQMVGEAIRHGDPWRLDAGKWVRDFQVALASNNLPGVSPRRGGIGDVRIVHPLGSFVGDDRSIVCRRNEEPTHVEVEWRISLQTPIGNRE